MIIHGDSLEVLKTLEANSVDSVVTDPPYGLSAARNSGKKSKGGFMGKRWDYDVPSRELWTEVLRVLKPGGHLLSFGGTRTYHRMVVAIEDAGFEIRDSLQWLQGQGFPKNLDVRKAAIKAEIACGCEKNSEHRMRPLSEADISETIDIEDESREVLQSSVSEQIPSELRAEGSSTLRREESLLEGRGLHRTGEGLQADTDAEPPARATERVCVGAHSGSGANFGAPTDSHRRSSPYKSQSIGQPSGEPKDLQESYGTLDGTPFPRCSDCKKPILQEGLGTALKPACEIICLARKPLSDKTVAKNVLKWGTGAINVDGCRIETQDNLNGGTYSGSLRPSSRDSFGNGVGGGVLKNGLGREFVQPQGRWPSNVIFDEEAAAVLDEQSGDRGISKGGSRGGKRSQAFGMGAQDIPLGFGDSGGASRFFKVIQATRFAYIPKASKRERNAGLEDVRNVHPTIKPLKLMTYLCRLITPPNGTVLDPFCGSGSTGVAAIKEGFKFIGIEREEQYVEIAKKRVGN